METQNKTFTTEEIYETKNSRPEASDRQTQREREVTSWMEALEEEINSIQDQYLSILPIITQRSEDLMRASGEDPIRRELSDLRHMVNLMCCQPDEGPQTVIPEMQRNTEALKEQLLTLKP